MSVLFEEVLQIAEIGEEERKDDSKAFISTLNNKMEVAKQMETNKIALIKDHLLLISSVEEENVLTRTKLENHSKTFIKESDERTHKFVVQLQHKEEKSQQNLTEQLQKQLLELENKIINMDERTRQKTKQKYLEIKENADALQEQVENHREELITEMENIQNEVSNQLNNLEVQLEERRNIQNESTKKISLMINKVWKDIEECIFEEKKYGEATYDCLLKLIEDSCSKIEKHQMN